MGDFVSASGDSVSLRVFHTYFIKLNMVSCIICMQDIKGRNWKLCDNVKVQNGCSTPEIESRRAENRIKLKVG